MKRVSGGEEVRRSTQGLVGCSGVGAATAEEEEEEMVRRVKMVVAPRREEMEDERMSTELG